MYYSSYEVALEHNWKPTSICHHDEACNAQVADPLAHPCQRIWGVWEAPQTASPQVHFPLLQTADLAVAVVQDPPVALHPAAVVAVWADSSLTSATFSVCASKIVFREIMLFGHTRFM